MKQRVERHELKQRVQRYEEIGEALARHGLGFIVGIAGLERWVPLHHGLLGHEPRTTPYTNPDHLRTALEELGPTFIKLGQLLSTRPDLLPPEYQSELSKLQDDAPPVPGPTIRQLIRDELGASEPSRLLCRLYTGCAAGWGAVI
ncbi:Probable ubiquinone biosynthesis protein UbiB [Kocuria rosea]|uniref:AarF/ABC1/UbiB kinase family protein n=1 Tax=Kocuria rosea TaxID=1275 RepID=UPI000DFB2AC0|nr:AarF/ABC1/UbiB kinase family protein [Kocuria rosea]STX03521.1 Probable ubiquinone biosynthesis protein UbiB [Kocuria rosea]